MLVTIVWVWLGYTVTRLAFDPLTAGCTTQQLTLLKSHHPILSHLLLLSQQTSSTHTRTRTMLSTMRSVAAITLALSALSVKTVSAIVAGPVTDAGCFDDSTGLDDNGVYNYQSKGHCQETCIGVGATVMAMTNANECWCGSSLPPKSALQSDNSKCNKACVGYPSDVCKLTCCVLHMCIR